jgi:hypothetical protein
MNGCKIYHNTVYSSPSPSNTGVGAFSITEWNTGIEGVEVYNNIFQTTGGAYLVNVPTGYDATFAGNLYWPTGGTFKIRYHGTNYSSVATWRTASGKEQIGNTFTGITADPLLLNAGNGGTISPSPTYSLAAYKTAIGSPAIDAGLNITNLFAINTGTIDFFTAALPAGNLRDIGAYEKLQPVLTAINDQTEKSNDISFYPNPVNLGEGIKVNGGEAPYIIEFYSLGGSYVSKSVIDSEYYIPGGVFAGGLYIIRITDKKGQVKTGKIMVY